MAISKLMARWWSNRIGARQEGSGASIGANIGASMGASVVVVAVVVLRQCW
jgi:hypothetical protein